MHPCQQKQEFGAIHSLGLKHSEATTARILSGQIQVGSTDIALVAISYIHLEIVFYNP